MGGPGALVLLLLFVVGIGINLARGRKPNCHCFGQLYSVPIGWPTLIRNGVLAAIAGFVVWQGRYDSGLGAMSLLSDLTIVQVVGLIGWVIVLGLLGAMGWFLINLLQQNGRLLVRLEALEARFAEASGKPTQAEVSAEPEPGLPVGAPAPAFSLSGLFGEVLTLDFLRAAANPVLLIFSDPDCGSCTMLLPEIARWQRDHAAKLTLALISGGRTEANHAKSTEHGLRHVMLQQDREVAAAYRVVGTPSAVIVRSDGTIGSPLAAGAEAIRALVTRTLGTPAQVPTPSSPTAAANGGCANCGNGAAKAQSIPRTVKIGDPAPAVKLPDLSGKTVDLADFHGSETLVLFWNPGCGFCQRMLSDLKAWEANPPPGAPKLLVVSTGREERNQAMGLRSPIVLDPGFATGPTFGARGTPSAVLVDERGNIASELAGGAPAVLALATGQDQTQAAR